MKIKAFIYTAHFPLSIGVVSPRKNLNLPTNGSGTFSEKFEYKLKLF